MDVNRVIRTHVTTGELEPPAELVSGINEGQVQLIEVVKGLGEYLVSTEDDTRLKGLSFLTNVIKTIRPSKINRQTTQTLTRFYLSKLDDFDSLSPALNALIVLSKSSTFDDDAAREVYQGLCENVNMKAHVQAVRHLVYQVFDSLLALHRDVLKGMGSDFINSYTKMVDGEKDPRNLMMLFSMDKVILLEFDVKPHIEELFDITFCYFPISFRPPPNDPYGITADDLKVALRACMSASPHFAKLALPLFLEKFTSAAGQSMKDLMLSMAECFPTYGAAAVRERGKELWEGIKTEIMYSSDGSIEAAALKACESLVRTLYPTQGDSPAGLAQDIIKESLEALEEPEKAQSLGATKILVALIRASPSAGTFAISQALPQLFRQFNRPTLPAHRAPIMAALSAILIACQSVYANPEMQRSQAAEKSLEPFHENIQDTLREGLRTSGLKISSIRGSVAIIDIPGFLGRQDVEDLIKGMNDVLVNDDDLETRQVVIKGLTTICSIHSPIIESVTLPLLFHRLPDQAPTTSDVTAREKYRSILDSLSQLCVQPTLFETLVIRINNKLELLASSSPATSSVSEDSSEDARECTVSYAFDLINALSTVIDSKLAAKHTDLVKYFDQIIPRLYSLVIAAAAPRVGTVIPVFRDRRLLSAIARVSETMTWELGADRQAKHLSAVYDGFEKGSMHGLVPLGSSSTSTSPLRREATPAEQDLIALYSSVVQGTKTETASPYPSAPDYLASKIYWTIRVASEGFQVRWALDLITAFVNKRINELGDSLEELLEQIWVSDVQDTSGDYEIRRRGLLVYLHIVKALALIRHPLSYTAADRIIDILALSNLDPVFVDEAARGFSILAEGKGKGKERGSHLTTKLLYAQKLWNYVLPKLIDGDKEASGKGRLAYLVAFSSLLPLIPSSLCLSDLDRLLPLLLRSLSLPYPAQRINTIITLTSVLETANLSASVDTLLHTNSVTLVDALLLSALRNPNVESSGAVRTTALRCLAIFPDVIRFEALQAQKSRVIRELGRALDDPLRSVRKEAVECRAKWYRYGGSGVA